MQDAIAMTYLWLKAGHIIFVVFWMAGLFMLPRQLIYVHPAPAGSEEEMRWVHRMGLLRKVILTPSLVVVWLLGLLMAWELGLFAGTAGLGWLHAKLLLVVLLTGFHGFLVAQAKRVGAGERPLSERQLRMLGEVPGLLLVLIVVLVVLKPF
ncbi:MAG TPA: CopD family protein [Erythrobacter sp.]|nr:CopD family protein [Erythrobacter sp.]